MSGVIGPLPSVRERWRSVRVRIVDALSAVRGGWPVTAAAFAWIGALRAETIPVPLVVAAVVAGFAIRRRVSAVLCCCLALFATTGALAERADAGLDGLVAADYAGIITLITDPEPTLEEGLRFEVDSDVGHLLVEVPPLLADSLGEALAGQHIAVSGSVKPFASQSPWTRSRHLAGTLDVEAVEGTAPAPPILGLANRYRTVLERGSESLSADHRSLLSGIVIGDDRAQPPEITADFRASGLTHLLAVSGQNLVFVLIVAMPLLRRLRLWPRYLASVGVVIAFATVTRFEPSVVRAGGVAVIALLATTVGRPSDGARHLALAACALLLIDPMLVHAIGFRLSVAASIGVLLIAPRVIEILRGPRWFREGLGVTVGAQIAVAPVLIPTFGPMPLAALPANVLAGPIAGFTMVWGLAAGTIAGLVGGQVATALHLPTRVALDAIEWVAAWSAALPLGRVDLRHLAVLAAALALWHRRPALRGLSIAASLMVVVASVITSPPLGERNAGFDATVWVDGSTAVVVTGPRARPADVLDELNRSQVQTVGLLVVSEANSKGAVAEAIRARLPVAAVIGPQSAAVDGLMTPSAGQRIRVGRLIVVVDDDAPHLRVRVGWR